MEKDEKRYVWVLLLEKSLQSEQELMDGINTVWVYDCFSKAKATMEQMLWQFASEKNGIFDGRGGILGLQSWLKEVGDVSEARILPMLVQNYIYQKEMNGEERREIDWSSPLSVGSVQWEGAEVGS